MTTQEPQKGTIEEILQEFGDKAYYWGYTSGDAIERLKNFLQKTITTLQANQSQQVEEAVRKMFNKIKDDINSLEYDTDGDTFKKIVLSRMSSQEWFEALTPNHQEPTHYRWNDKVQELAERVGNDIRSQESNHQD